MRKKKTHFEQVPLEHILDKIATIAAVPRRVGNELSENVVVERPENKTEPYTHAGPSGASKW